MKRQVRSKKKRRAGLPVVALIGILALASGILVFRAASHPASQRPEAGFAEGPSETAESVPPYFSSAAAAQPFPRLLPAADFGGFPSVQRAYAIAAQIPGVLAQQPCYCHCDQVGHHSLLDCYASQHAAGCGVCLMEALFAGRMTQQGQSAASIRQQIIRGAWRDVGLREPLP